MEDMINLQVDYFSIPSKQIIELSKGYINNNIEYFEKLSKWDNVLDKNSVEEEYILNGKLRFILNL